MAEVKVYPLASVSLERAKEYQFKAIDLITRNFDGREVLSLGDLGVVMGTNRPLYTIKAEKVFAGMFDAEDAILVRGSGTGALRWSFIGAVEPGGTVLVHDAAIYPTTKISMDGMCLKTVKADFNDLEAIRQVVRERDGEIDGVLVQHTRQKIDDSYDFCQVVGLLRELLPQVPIITDDNYAALKVERIGCQAGADLATFSCFKLLGPEGVGVIIGKKKYIDAIREKQYSGGSQVQGHEAMAALRGLVYAPVALAVQSSVNDELICRLNAGEVKGVRRAFVANAQSKVLLVEFETDCAKRILEITPSLGAAAHPVGSESIYEFAPMIYRVSGTFRATDPTLENRMIRINPMRSGPDTIIRILRQAIEKLGEAE